MNKTGIVRDPLFMEHEMGAYHPESPLRLEAIYEKLDAPDMAGKFFEIPTRLATKDEICTVHNDSYFERVAQTDGQTVSLDPDTSTSPASFKAALTAAGGGLNAVDKLFSGDIDNGFALVRPPGHHAEANRAMGFCIFNNIAIAAQYALKNHGCKKIAIVDWDLHHGNGTQNSFYGDDNILYCSSHQSPFYPGSGDWGETGWEKGEGYTVNIPLSVGHGDGDYGTLYSDVFNPLLKEFNPDLLLISAGFDILFSDPLGGMRVTPKGFLPVFDSLIDVAEECCASKYLVFLEGGYDIEGEAEAVRLCLNLMTQPRDQRSVQKFNPENPDVVKAIRNQVATIHSEQWKSLKTHG